MQVGKDGEYIPSKQINVGFKIPRLQHTESVHDVVAEPTVLSASTIEQTQTAILRNIHKLGNEKPKTYPNHILRETIPDRFDDTLPAELTALFQPLYCKLCTAQLSSNVVAKLHYKSKNHEKKIRKFLVEHAEKHNLPLHERAKVPARAKDEAGEEQSNSYYFYCNVCDLPLTGKLHAESHYLGKNHRKASLGLQHQPKKKAQSGDGFGGDFHMVQGPQLPAGFRCELCNVTTTCSEQLEAHYLGQKHRKKAKQQEVAVDEVVPAAVSPDQNILGCLQQESLSKVDCSVYRTPSGHYYCQICNSSMNSEAQFKQHLQSKGHLRKAVQKREGAAK